ncbi:MAG: type II secretion system protein GspM [Rubrivivax sp.]|nr:type II secretion system protein GspM [Rubrivivax sp.]
MSETDGTAGQGTAAALSTAARAWWHTLAVRERRLVLAAGTVLGLFLTWSLAVQPAWRSIDRAAAERNALEAQWQTMQRLAAEAQQLRAAPPVSQEQALAALQAAAARLGSAGRLTLQGDRAVLTLNGVGTHALRDWLAEARTGARAQPVEAKLSRTAAGYVGTLVMVIGGGP